MHFTDAEREQLHGSQRLLRAWSKNELPKRAGPLPINFVLAMVGAALEAQTLRIAMSLLTGFHALLRSNDIIHIQASHFTFTQRMDQCCLCYHVPETATVTDTIVLACIWAVVPRLQPGERLFHVHFDENFTEKYS